MNEQLTLIVLCAGVSVFLIVFAIGMPKERKAGSALPSSMVQFRPRSAGRGKLFEGVANASIKRALRRDTANARYLRHLKQANWYWEVGEPNMPNPKAPFWNVETLWGEKWIGTIIWASVTFGAVAALGLLLGLSGKASFTTFILVGGVLGAVMGFMAFTNPDSQVAAAAAKRQRELSLEMGFRIPELRADVIAGATIQRAMRGMAKRPGGPFVEELRRAVMVLDVTRDESQAMDYLLDRSQGNELMMEFANSVKMVSRQGGQIGPVLNVLADLAQQQLRLSITGQARKNLQEMTRPIGLSSLIVTTMLIIFPALTGIMSGLTR
jgi:Type II secretion system (T2SS), protein F